MDRRSSLLYNALSSVPFIKQATTVSLTPPHPAIFSYYVSIALLAAG
jgi:hypothetical protein